MNKLAISVLMGAMIAIFLAACEPRKERIEKTHDRTGSPIVVTIYTYESQRHLDATYRELHGIRRGEDRDQRYGFARWPEWRDVDGNTVDDGGEWTCEIHVLAPQYIDDERTLTLGHEMVHCIYGSYHE